MSKPNTQPMPRYPLFNAIVAKNFFENYCQGVRNWKHKLRGKDGNGNPIDFTPEDKKIIGAGFRKMVRQLKRMDIVK